jgi:ABC-type multidrug transport system ATPase subunit
MLLRKLADNGQAIFCTIHQPSAQIFQIFDCLLLLDKNGQTSYFGDIGKDSSTLVRYFERNGAPPCDIGGNPAEWIIDVSATASQKDWATIWTNSPEKKEVISTIETFNVRKGEWQSNITVQGDEFASSLSQQMVVVLQRTFAQYWRDPTYLYSKLALSATVVSQ